MQINSDNIIKDAQRLRGTGDDIKSRKAGDGEGKTAPANRQLEISLDQMNVNLRTHQQTVARLQLESIGLDQIERGIEFIIKNNPGDYEDLRRAMNETRTAADATRFQQQPLIPQTLRDALFGDLLEPGTALAAKALLDDRKTEIDATLKQEFAQISKIQVSFENFQSLNIPLDGKAGDVVNELKDQLLKQRQLVQAPMDPATVMNLLRV